MSVLPFDDVPSVVLFTAARHFEEQIINTDLISVQIVASCFFLKLLLSFGSVLT